MEKLKLACMAGARAIANSKKLQGATYTLDPFNKCGEKGEISYYQAEILLHLFTDCIGENGIDTEKLNKHIENLDNYRIER